MPEHPQLSLVPLVGLSMGDPRMAARTWAWVVLAASVLTFTGAAPASAAGTLAWSSPQLGDHQPPFAQATDFGGVSCLAGSLCVAVGGGHVVASTDPTGGFAVWTGDVVFSEPGRSGYLGAVSCASASLCVAGGLGTGLVVSTNPTGGAGAWRQTVPLPASRVAGVSCPSANLCVAAVTTLVGGRLGPEPTGAEILTSTDPTGGASAWKVATVGNEPGGLDNVTCPSVSLCVAGDASGNIVTSTDPTGGASAWTVTTVENQPPFSLPPTSSAVSHARPCRCA